MAFPLHVILFCFLSLPTVCVFAQTRSGSTASVGDSLYAGKGNTTWLISPSGDFAFGFQPLERDDDGFFLLSIWYDKIPEKTIVWYANGDSPAPKGSKVELTAEGGILLTSPDGGELWKPDSVSGNVAHGAMDDSGNFVLQDRDFKSLWESFKNPRDTTLPSQLLVEGGKLSSRWSETNFTKGRFQLILQEDGNLVMHSINLPSEYANENYYESGAVESNSSASGLSLITYMLSASNDTFNLSRGVTDSPTQYYLRVTLNFDGVLTLYQHPKSSFGNETWTPLWSLPENICTKILLTTGSGVCGYNSICSLNDYNRPICQCLKGYSLLDPKEPYGSCKPDFIQGCEEDELRRSKDLYEFEMLINTDWPFFDYALQRPFTEEECKQSCMEDCMCTVAIFRLGDSCWKKKWPLSYGRYDASLNGSKAFIKVRKDNSSLVGHPTTAKRKNRRTLTLVGSVLLGGSAFLNFILTGAICFSFSFFYQYHKKQRRINLSDSVVENNLRCFTYKELEKATNGFKEELGRGAFGVVYKGTINMGSTIHIAVKRLNNFVLKEIEKEFKNEVNVIGQTHHKNLVRLLGFCEEGAERILVYEYMSNGTLASLLFKNSKPSWNLRLRIAFGIARGLVYLHEDCNNQIIHCDIKPQNILLDDYFNARISDFGLAKLLNMNQSRTNTAIRGTKGYVALEWFKNMPITAKVDVFSFGVLLLEVICCRKSADMEAEDEEKAILSDWAYDCYREGCVEALVEDDEEALEDRKNLEKLVMIAIWCVKEDPNVRPTMRKVAEMLAGIAQVHVPPYQVPLECELRHLA